MSDSTGRRDSIGELAGWGTEEELNPLDALMWRTERPPSDSWTGVVMILLDEGAEWDVVRSAHEWALHIVPRFTQRVVDPLLPTGPPHWVADDDFDLDYHLRRFRLPAPGTVDQVEHIAQNLAVTPLDRRRPPWQAMFIEGLEGGRSAYLLQAHHVVMDGGAATQLFSRILDRTPEEAAASVEAAKRRRGRPSTVAVTPFNPVTPVQASVRGLQWQAKAARKGLGFALRTAGAARRNPVGSVVGAARYVGSVRRVASALPPAESNLLTPGPRTKWRFRSFECDLVDLKRASKTVGGTINDAFVTAVLGGLRTYHEHHGETLGDVPISMPVSVRRPGEMGGNRFAAAFFSAPSGTEGAAERIQEMRRRVSRVREEPALDMINNVTPLMNLAPTPLVSAAIGAVATSATLTTSCWPGVPFDTWFAGARVDGMWVFGPLPGTTMCASLASHAGKCCIALNVDGDTYPDTEVLWKSIQAGIDEVLDLGR